MRFLQLIAVAFVGLSVAFAPAAHAKKDKDDKGDTDYVKIEMTGIKAFDDVFKEVKAIQKNLSAVESSIDNTTGSLVSTLGLAKDTPLTTALADLKSKADGKLEVAMSGTTPKLSTSDAVPANVQQAIDAVNTGIAEVTASIDGLKAIPDQMKSLQTAVTAMPTQLKDPNIIKGVPTADLLKAPKTLKNNLKATSQTTDRARSTKDAAVNFMGAFTGSFGEATPGAGAGSAGGSDAAGGTRGGTRGSGGAAGGNGGAAGGNGNGNTGDSADKDKGNGNAGGGGRTRGGGNR